MECFPRMQLILTDFSFNKLILYVGRGTSLLSRQHTIETRQPNEPKYLK